MSESGEKSEKQQRTPLRFRIWVAIAFLMALGLLALYNTNNEWRSARTPGQAVATLTELIYGVCAIFGTIALVKRSRWARPLLLAFAACATATAGLAPHVWAGAPVTPSIIAAVAGAVISAGILLLALPRRASSPIIS